MPKCPECFEVSLPACVETIIITEEAGLDSETEYTLQIYDQFNNLYEIAFETDLLGKAEIEIAGMVPEGLFDVYSGTLSVEVHQGGCPVPLTFCGQEYSCIALSFLRYYEKEILEAELKCCA